MKVLAMHHYLLKHLSAILDASQDIHLKLEPRVIECMKCYEPSWSRLAANKSSYKTR